ncbi:hypothetical protein I3843_01G170300 [Carya illinoinensis]|uniref:Uncharacterized protein n=2 Tax=Carya illinoinensis TaxID=32201 RepID=A0A8T1RNU5_CARIL|nr:uncharacterized protein LOC122276384 [Carya illinoinensis]KAG2727783.1 hypothetical protein I3760_01G174200 [Carya illinoinensis]KAG6668534.1 hypothetical protein CIPAW_01G177500 [Carya illinoinensis]KAG7996627.1 hypothetical protein I3843_01G170300 [Carya illinoinensis]
MLHSSPSFSIYHSGDEFQDLEGRDPSQEALERTITIGESLEAIGSGEFSFNKKSMSLIVEREEEKDEVVDGIQSGSVEEEANEPPSPPLYLATGLGIDTSGFGVGGGRGFDEFNLAVANFDDGGDVEEYCKRMVDEYPCHPLFLRKYAQVLQSKGDLQGAEEYYYRATLADPEDGEIMVLYAKLVWEHHHDQDRALSYFERAAQAAPQDSPVLAAYASFLWEIEDDKEEYEASQAHIQIEQEKRAEELEMSTSKEKVEIVSSSQHAPGLKIDVAGFPAAESSRGSNVEEYHKKMVEDNPNNPLFLRNYAQFLCQSKGDLQTAEEFYMRTILADPSDGEIMSQYAKLVWELYHDQDKALSYFERAVQASPGDSHVLAAYASFLWETEDEEDGDPRHGSDRALLIHG